MNPAPLVSTAPLALVDAPQAMAQPTFKEVFATHRARVFALCLHLTGSRAEAEDALQETFLAVHQGLPAFRGDASLTTWIMRIAIRMGCQARARRRAGEAVPEDAVDSSPLPDDATDARRQAQRLQVAMQKLSVEHRTVLSLFALEGLRHAEIAEVLGLPEGTIWSRLHLARKRLAEAMRG